VDIFSYARTPNGPISELRVHGTFAAALAGAAGFYLAGRHVADTGSVPVLAAMTVTSVLGFVAAFRFTRATMRLSARAARMAADFKDEAPAELGPGQLAIFSRLANWHSDNVSEGGALAAMWGGLVLGLVPLGMLITQSVPTTVWATVAGLSGFFATLLLTMTSLEHMAIRPVVGVLARAQLTRLEAGAADRAPESSAPDSARRARRPLSDTRR